GPPGGKGTTRRTGFAGNSWAVAPAARAKRHRKAEVVQRMNWRLSEPDYNGCMSAVPSKSTSRPEITAALHYTVDSGVAPVNEPSDPNNIRRRVTGENEVRQMTIRNGRPLVDEFDLEVTGFEFVEHKTKVHNFFDIEELKRVYYPEVEALIKKVSGASRVVVFDHTLRSGDEAEREAKLVREPVLNVHNDYTEWSGPQRVRDLLPDGAEELLKRRFAI